MVLRFYTTLLGFALCLGCADGSGGNNAAPAPEKEEQQEEEKEPSDGEEKPKFASLSSDATLTLYSGVEAKFSVTVDTKEKGLSCDSDFLSFESSDESIIDSSDITIAGTFPDCELSIQPKANTEGTANLKISLKGFNNKEATVEVSVTLTLSLDVLGQANRTSNKQLENGLNFPEGICRANDIYFIADAGNNRVIAYNGFPDSSSAKPIFALGQKTLGENIANNGGISAATMSFPVACSSDGTRLAVVDRLNNRVLIWNTIPTQSGTSADLVVGQPDFISSTANTGGLSGSVFDTPMDVLITSGKLFVTDRENNRVLVWNSLPTSNGQSASFALGQPAGASNLNADTAALGAGSISDSWGGLLEVNGNLYVSDGGASRILKWNTLPSAPTDADFVWGQTGLTTFAAPSTTDTGLRRPGFMCSDGVRLVVSDIQNERYLMFAAVPFVNDTGTNGAPAATYVIGKPDMTTQGTNSASVNAIHTPSGCIFNGSKVLFVDKGNHRVLGYNSLPDENEEDANFVIGQPSFTGKLTNNVPAAEFDIRNAESVFVDENYFIITDSDNHRVLIWNDGVPNGVNATPDVVVGQVDLYGKDFNRGGARNAGTLSDPHAAIVADGKLIVSEAGNRRVLVWNAVPTSNGVDADLVLGQPGFTSNGSGTGAANLATPYGLWSDGQKLIVVDGGNNRALVWNTFPTMNGQPANLVIGQSAFGAGSANGGGSTSNKVLSGPKGIAVHNDTLVIADTGNNRVLIWDAIPTMNDAPANEVLGQPDFDENTANNGGISASRLAAPNGVSYSDKGLMVADLTNHRVLTFEGELTRNKPASKVYGQPDFTSSTINNGGQETGLQFPNAVSVWQDVTFIGDRGNSRALINKD